MNFQIPHTSNQDDLCIDSAIDETAASLIRRLQSFSSVVVAFSGGVDSAVVSKAAFLAIGRRAIAVTGVGPAVSQVDLRWADEVASQIGIEHFRIDTNEIHDSDYLRNDAKRCYFCKSSLYSTLKTWAQSRGIESILSGTNADDLGDYRPGIEAGRLANVVTPLADLQFGKATVRALAKYWNLPVADRAASPCLASRIAYGEPVTVDKLKMIESAESWLADRGYKDVRVRLHSGNLARIELPAESLTRFFKSDDQADISDAFRSIGFTFVTIDLGGRKSGSMNQMLPILGSSNY